MVSIQSIIRGITNLRAKLQSEKPEPISVDALQHTKKGNPEAPVKQGSRFNNGTIYARYLMEEERKTLAYKILHFLGLLDE